MTVKFPVNLLLSDILGTEEDTIYRDLETEAERKLLVRAINQLSSREKLIVKMRFGLDNPDVMNLFLIRKQQPFQTGYYF